MRQYREKWVSGAFVQQTGTNAPSSFTGLNASSQTNLRDLTLLNVASLANLTVNSLTGAAGWRGIGVLSAAITTTSIQATAAQSGAVIQLTIYNYSTVDSLKGVMVASVGAGFFRDVRPEHPPVGGDAVRLVDHPVETQSRPGARSDLG